MTTDPSVAFLCSHQLFSVSATPAKLNDLLFGVFWSLSSRASSQGDVSTVSVLTLAATGIMLVDGIVETARNRKIVLNILCRRFSAEACLAQRGNKGPKTEGKGTLK
jgi:hypothetical protein